VAGGVLARVPGRVSSEGARADGRIAVRLHRAIWGGADAESSDRGTLTSVYGEGGLSRPVALRPDNLRRCDLSWLAAPSLAPHHAALLADDDGTGTAITPACASIVAMHRDGLTRCRSRDSGAACVRQG